MFAGQNHLQVIQDGKTAKAFLERDIINRKFLSNYARIFHYLLEAEGASEADLIKAVRQVQAFARIHRDLFRMVVEAEQIARAMGLDKTPSQVQEEASEDIPLSGDEVTSPGRNRGVSDLVEMAVNNTGDNEALDEFAAEQDEDF